MRLNACKTTAKLCCLTAAALALGFAAPANAATEAECEVLRNGPTVSASGKLSPAYSKALANSGRVVAADGTVDPAVFMEACKLGVFSSVETTATNVSMAPEPGAPFPGANSYTETQAREHIESAGFTSVSGLKKDDQGIWRATAMKTGKPMTVALDYKGNVVAK